MVSPLNDEAVHDIILRQRKSVKEETVHFLDNFTKGVQDLSKGTFTIDSARRGTVGGYEANKDFSKIDVVYAVFRWDARLHLGFSFGVQYHAELLPYPF